MQSETLDTIYLDDHPRGHRQVLEPTEGPLRIEPSAESSENTCRICLEPCPAVRFCMCSGGMLTHQDCLIAFLNVKLQKQRIKLSSLECEICREEYEVEARPSCTPSLQHCKRKIGEGRMRCLVYSLFFLVAILFYSLMGFLFVTRPLSDVARVVLIIVAVCLFLMFVLFLSVWLYEYLFKQEVEQISRVLPYSDRSLELPHPTKIHPSSSSQLNLNRRHR